MEEVPLPLADLSSSHARRLTALNLAAERVLFLNRRLIAVGEQLEKIREALGAYRRGEVGGDSISVKSKRAGKEGDIFLGVDPSVACEFLVEHQERLRQRRQEFLQQRRKALRDLMELEPSTKEAMGGGWAFLLRGEPRTVEASDEEES